MHGLHLSAYNKTTKSAYGQAAGSARPTTVVILLSKNIAEAEIHG